MPEKPGEPNFREVYGPLIEAEYIVPVGKGWTVTSKGVRVAQKICTAVLAGAKETSDEEDFETVSKTTVILGELARALEVREGLK